MQTKTLSALGLSASEIKIYNAIAKMGPVSPVALAKATGVKRTTAYSLGRSLVEKGLAVEDTTKRPRVFTPTSPKDVKQIVSLEKERLDAKAELYAQVADELSKMEAEKTYPVPQVRFIEEDKMEQFYLNRMSEWNKSLLKSDATWWGFQDKTYPENFPHLIDAYMKKAPSSIKVKLLSNQTPVEKKLRTKYPNRTIKFWGAGNFLSSIWIAGEYVITLNTGRRPYYTVETHDAMLAHDLREIFKALWATVA